jgi:flagellar secretion chaperone FliS
MFGTHTAGINQYKQVGIDTGVAAANPIELVVMLYEGAIVACNEAIPYLHRNDYQNKSHYLFKAIRIIQAGLRISLDKQAGGKIAEDLDSLYAYMINVLIKANVNNDVKGINEVVRLLSELKGAWQEISKTDAVNVVTKSRQAIGTEAVYLERV